MEKTIKPDGFGYSRKSSAIRNAKKLASFMGVEYIPENKILP